MSSPSSSQPHRLKPAPARGPGSDGAGSGQRGRCAVRWPDPCTSTTALDHRTEVPVTVHDRPFGRYFEDFEIGDVYRHWPGKTITEADDHLFCMITMNHHPLHTNEWFAQHETVHGKNVVVGNLVYSLVLGMSVPDVSGAAIANLEVETLTHSRPTFHGDTIYAVTKVLDKRESGSRPDRGVVTVETRAFNQRSEEVCYFRRKVMIWKREAGPERRFPYSDETAVGEG
ncbi:MaoC family dehydratase [Candidatus Poriferisodalis sp.]|uniref:MaoC family dehydratase n=1 Tax=Candidatus Poriferisodalis sp. TaxID=3101277 RepID=UPI003B01A2AC